LPVAAQHLPPPRAWRWTLDAPARLTDRPLDPTASDTLWRFISVPTGWQITTGPGVLLYPAEQPSDTNYVVETEITVLPGSSDDELGLFVAGTAANGDSTYTAFLVRPDGAFAVVRRTDTTSTYLVPWSRHPAVAARVSENRLVRQLMRLRVTRSTLALAVNGVEIATLPRGSLSASGRVGLRLGGDLDVRVSSLKLTYQFAPSSR
ncbi:MAG: hypothetical protein OEO21_11130, partial [Candidatus Krumholzibacteria bacterium]|nr:hypothetical protein [Candidatus Krumholzibacteria bacterium]